MSSELVFGRDRELRSVEAFLGSAADGLRVLAILGGAGIGKSTLWRAALDRASSTGSLVLSCQGGPFESGLALSGLADLFEGVPTEVVAALPSPQRRAVDVTLLRADAGAAGVEPRAITAATRSVLGGLAELRPLLIGVDDVPGVDTASLSVLRNALFRLRNHRVRCLVTERRGATEHSVTLDLAPAERTETVVLGPLDPAATHRLLTRHFGHPLTRPQLHRIHEASAGNPLHAIELARANLEAQSDPAAPGEEDVRVLIERRLADLDDDTRDALLQCAASTRPTTRALSEVRLEAAERAGIVTVADDGAVRFTHPLYAAAVYDTVPVIGRRRVHARLAALVTDPEERGRHLALSQVVPDGEVATALDAAARQARRRGAWDSAGELWEHAARLTPLDRPEERTARLLEAAEHQVHAGDRARGRALVEQVVAGRPEGALLARAHFLLGEIAYNDESHQEAMSHFTSSLAAARDAGARATSMCGLAFVGATTGDFAGGAAWAHRALAEASVAEHVPQTAEMSALVVVMDFLCGHPAQWDLLADAVRLEDPDAVVSLHRSPRLVQALMDLYVGRHGAARDELAAVCEAARRRGDESDLPFVLMWWSWLETRLGHLEEARRLVDEGAWVAEATGSRANLAWVLAQGAYVDAHRGDRDGTLAACASASSALQQVGTRLPMLWIAAATALVENSCGHPRAAWDACRPIVETIEASGMPEPVPYFFLPDALEALVACGEIGRADALADLLLDRGRATGRAWALAIGYRGQGLVRAAAGEVDGAVESFTRSLAENDRIEMPFARARTELLLGIAHRRARRRQQARTCLASSLATFERLGAERYAERTRQELARTGLSRVGAELSETERRVAELAGGGRTNRQIAATLFVSPKTVEANLAHVYGKLGIHSRAELGAAMARQARKGRETPDSTAAPSS